MRAPRIPRAKHDTPGFYVGMLLVLILLAVFIVV